jgi:multidrug efflux system membrane fusion protein
MNDRTTAVFLCLAAALCGGVTGCGSTPEAKEDKKPECMFVYAQVKDDVQDYVEYTGRTSSRSSVDIKARVTGFLKAVYFKGGTWVEKGQKLYLIDPEPYLAQLEQARAQVKVYEAQVELTSATYEKGKLAVKGNPNTLSDLQVRTFKAQMDEAKATLKAAQAGLKIYELNVKYTTVEAPMDGVVGRNNVSAENVILQDQTLLTTLVSLDPIWVYFDMDAPTYTRFQKAAPGKAAQEAIVGAPVSLELPGAPASLVGSQPARVAGKIDFVNNQFNPATDTVLGRGVFANPKSADRSVQLRPGMFVRLKLSIGQPYKALLLPDRAILSKMGKKYVYTVGPDNRVKEIPVDIGQVQDKGMRVIRGGQLTDEDRVVVTRLLDIQPKQEIRAIPLPPPPGEAAPPAVRPDERPPAEKNGKAGKGK